MGSFEGGFSPSPESFTALDEIQRAEMLADVARMRVELSSQSARQEVARNPELAAMLGKLVECGAELSPATKLICAG